VYARALQNKKHLPFICKQLIINMLNIESEPMTSCMPCPFLTIRTFLTYCSKLKIQYSIYRAIRFFKGEV